MEKNFKKLKVVILSLIVVLISVIAFYGLYTCKYGVWNNVIPEFKKGMEFSGMRELRFSLSEESADKEVYVDQNGNVFGEVSKKDSESEQSASSEPSAETSTTETEQNAVIEEPEEVKAMNERLTNYTVETRTIKENEDSVKNIDNYTLAKDIIQKRMEKISSYEYNIRQDSITGEIILEVPNNDNISLEEGLVTIKGNFELVDYQNGLVLINNSHVKSATVIGNTDSDNHYQVYLQVNFDETGRALLKEISNQYQSVTDSTGKSTNYYVSAALDGETLTTTYFGEEIANGVITIPMGEAFETYEEYVSATESVQNIANVIDGETLPIKYELSSDNYIVTDISNQIKVIIGIVGLVVILCISIYFIIKFKSNGLKAAIFAIGYIAALSLVIRYTNVYLTINSFIAFICMILLNYVFNYRLLKNLKKETAVRAAVMNTLKDFYIFVIPVCIVALIFTFRAALIINSVGMMLFWGLVLIAIYNVIMFCI